MVLCLFSQCNESVLSVKDYVAYMNNPKNGLVIQKEVDGVMFKLSYITPELMALNELKKVNISAKEWDEKLAEYKGMMYANLSISAVTDDHVYTTLGREGLSEDEIDFNYNLNAESDFMLLRNADTVKCVLYSFSKTYGLAKTIDLALGFDATSEDNSGDKVVEYNAEFLNRGLLKFRFKQSDLANIPSVKI